MFISIVGTRGSGKSMVEKYLVSTYNFQPVRIREAKLRDNLRFNNFPQGSNLSVYPVDIPNIKEKVPEPLCFESPTRLLDYVTEHWLESFVTCDLDIFQDIQLFNKRPFFLLVFVDAPLLIRYNRLTRSFPNLNLRKFVDEHDALFYGLGDPSIDEPIGESQAPLFRDICRLADIHVVNSYQNLDDLHAHLHELNLLNPDRLRPGWDTYFMTLADLASRRSNCMKRRVGAILVRDKRIVATGYNGTPRNTRNCNEGGCPRCNRGGPSGEALDECLCLHAEENALLEAGRERVGAGAVLYCNTCPCLGCAIKIVQTGVKEVVYNLSYKLDDRTAALFNEAGVVLRQHSPPS